MAKFCPLVLGATIVSLELLILRPTCVFFGRNPNEDILQRVWIGATIFVPFLHCSSDLLETRSPEPVNVRVRTKDLQVRFFGHLRLDLLPVTRAFLFLHLNHEAIGDLTFLLVKPEGTTPAALSPRPLCISREIPAFW